MRAFRCFRSGSLLIAVALTAVASPATAGTITFDEPLLALVHGEVVDTDFAGVTITAVNPNKAFDLAVVFDTTVMGTSDPDLEDPFTAGNAAGEREGERAAAGYLAGPGIAATAIQKASSSGKRAWTRHGRWGAASGSGSAVCVRNQRFGFADRSLPSNSRQAVLAVSPSHVLIRNLSDLYAFHRPPSPSAPQALR